MRVCALWLGRSATGGADVGCRRRRRTYSSELYARPVIAECRGKSVGLAGVLVAFIGLWTGHTLEYLRVWGTDGLSSPLHAYMLPVAGVLAVLSTVFAIRIWRAWQALNHRLDRAVAGLRRIWRGHAAELPVEPAASASQVTRLVAIWLPLAAVQITLYVIQENFEALAQSRPASGLGPITGIHWAAPFVHLYVALLLACGIRIFQFLLHRRGAIVERVEALLSVAIRRRRAPTPRPAAAPLPRLAPPLRRFGRHLWRRPPPLLLDV
jgi:hypothetical protein